MYQVYNDYAIGTATEVLRQETDLLNAASNGCITFAPGPIMGDFKFETFWASIPDLVKTRNAYGTGAIATKDMAMLESIGVKVGMGTYPVNLPPSAMEWIQRSPEEAGAALGLQIAKLSLVSMINNGVKACLAATAGQSAVIYDGTADTPDTLTNQMLIKGAGKMGDNSGAVGIWVMHSYSADSFLLNNISNVEKLYTYENVNVLRDVTGRVFLVSDIPALFTAGSPNLASVLGLTKGAIKWTDNNDFTDNFSTTNGEVNIKRTFQSEWSWNLELKGYKWNTAAGGHSPDDATLATGTNWIKTATSHKDLAGVLVKTN